MKRYKRIILEGIVIAVVVAVAVGYVFDDALGHLLVRGFVFFGVREAQHGRVRLLCETDHQALLEACRELSRRCARGELKPGRYSIRRDPDPEVSRFPKAILDLAPSYIYIDENDSGRVMVEMHGGLDHFGVEAYTEDYKKPAYAEHGDRKLIDGLWYRDEGYVHNPQYDKIVEAIIQKGK